MVTKQALIEATMRIAAVQRINDRFADYEYECVQFPRLKRIERRPVRGHRGVTTVRLYVDGVEFPYDLAAVAEALSAGATRPESVP